MYSATGAVFALGAIVQVYFSGICSFPNARELYGCPLPDFFNHNVIMHLIQVLSIITFENYLYFTLGKICCKNFFASYITYSLYGIGKNKRKFIDFGFVIWFRNQRRVLELDGRSKFSIAQIDHYWTSTELLTPHNNFRKNFVVFHPNQTYLTQRFFQNIISNLPI